MKNHHPQTEQPRIYVACLAAYNNGILHGAWIEATDAWSMWEVRGDNYGGRLSDNYDGR